MKLFLDQNLSFRLCANLEALLRRHAGLIIALADDPETACLEIG